MKQKSQLELSPRLQLIADWVTPDARIADIGTDHAYLPVWLVLQNRVQTAIAGDLRRGPLDRAELTGITYGVHDKIDFRLCNGLQGIELNEVDTIIVADRKSVV